jgi:outer membrane lipoprotein carrier protein
MRCPKAAAVAAALFAAAAFSAAAASPEDVARSVEARLRQPSGLRARFVQSYRSGMLGREVQERGILSLKRPGRMRWDYESPEKKTFVSDGSTFYFYVPADRQVIVREQKDATGVAGLLLSGQGGLVEPFVPSVVPDAPAGLVRLRLVPRKPDPEIEELQLDVDPAFRVRAIEVLDPSGNRSRFEFDDLKENVGLKDDLFRFQVPRGVEVISG